ncbi:hypothetical protein GCM10022291_15440 [Postechiella marina]|uniref:Bacterial Ig-like domain-containing protein n=1 Tax=Postechiella marina TaxID=943941 RepID=A0ABP8C738_9FLAO
MKQIYITAITFLLGTYMCFSQFTETFEGFSDNQNTFTSNSQPFTTGVSGFNVETNFQGFGASNSNVFVDNSFNESIGDINSIKTTNGINFTIKDIDIFLSKDSGNTVGGTPGGLIIRGKKAGVTQFTVNITSGIPTGFSPDNGFFNVNFATEGGADNSLTNIDEIEFELTGDFIYIAVDEFTFGPEVVAADTSPPVVQSIVRSGTPETTADAVDFIITFNEDANNVTLDDFELDLTGSVTATLSSISGSGTNYTVSTNGISGEGSLSVDLKANTDIVDSIGNGNGTNGSTNSYTNGETHTVSSCFLESFEGTSNNDTSFTSNGISFSSTGGLNIETIADAGAGDSDKFLSNEGIVSASYAIQSSGVNFTIKTIDLYLSSNSGGNPPTNDGTITINGKLSGSTLYTITKNSGFPTSIANGDNGFFNLNFATEGASDYTTTNVDEIEIILSGAFVYLAIDHFEFCEPGVVDTFAPDVLSIDVSGNPTSVATTVDYIVTFDENVTNVSADDFSIDSTGSISAAISNVTGSGSVYTVTVSDILGFGTISIDLNAATDIQDGLSNSGPPAYTNGENHTISECFIEDFESFAVGSSSLASNDLTFITTGVDIFELNEAGVDDSHKYLDNESSGAGIFTVETTGALFRANSLYVYLSSIAAANNPTNDGSIIIKGKKGNIEQFSATLNTSNTTFPTSTAQGNNGFFQIDFSSLDGSDVSSMLIDELEFEIVSDFVYIGLDNFEFCQDKTPPTVAITSGESNPTGANPIPVTITFSEEVTGFDLADITVGNGVASNVQTSDNIIFTADITPSANGTVTVDVAANVATDEAGNNNSLAMQFSTTYDFSLSTNYNVSSKNDITFVNPVTNILELNSSSQISRIKVFSINGVEVLSGKGSVLNVSGLVTGMYLASVTLLNDDASFTIKFIKE